MTIFKRVFSRPGIVLIFALIVLFGINPMLLAQDEPPDPQEVHSQQTMTLKDYYDEYVGNVPITSSGAAANKGIQHGLTGLAEDALQAIGQIILDRATNAAFDLLKKRMLDFLKCNETGCSTDQWCFPETCKVIGNIRFQELVTARNVLYKGFIRDVFFNISKKIDKLNLTGEEKQVMLLLKGIILDVLLEKLTNINRPLDSISIGISTERFIDFFIRRLKDHKTIKKEILNTSLAALTVWKARAELQGNKFNKASMKPFLDEILKNLGGSHPLLPSPGSNEYFRALKTADLLHESIVLAASVTSENMTNAWNDLLDILSETAYYIVAPSDKSGKVKEYQEAKHDFINKTADLKNATHILFITEDILEGAINKDINTIIYTVSMVLKYYETIKYKNDKANSKVAKLRRRAIKMIGVVLLYAQTYADKDLDEQAAQAKRTQLISSLVTDRKVREHSGVFSFGGSLRGILQLNSWKKGIDEATGKKKSTYGPYSLAIGLGFDYYLGKTLGIHLEFDIVDLGHFTSFDGGTGVVEKPRLSDVFAPSGTAGLFFDIGGYPLYIGGIYGYSPKYYNAENNIAKKGTLNFGFTLGIYIPLFDFN
jgi:hypothetical protein